MATIARRKKEPPSIAIPKSHSRPQTPPSNPQNAPSPRPVNQPSASASSTDFTLAAPLPDHPYQEFPLLSSSDNGWKYDVMKFESQKSVDLTKWQTPVKLNRKDPSRPGEQSNGTLPEGFQPVPMVGPDGKPVIGPDGTFVLAGPDNRPLPPGGPSAERIAQLANNKGRKPFGKGRGGPFKKKTRQVFTIPEETRRLRREERYPWILEDGSGSQVWVGMMEDAKRSETHAFFVPGDNNQFRFVPAHRWYKLQKRGSGRFMTAEEVEVEEKRILDAREQDRWGRASGTAAFVSGSLVRDSKSSVALGGRKLKTVHRGSADLFGDDDDDGADSKRRVARELGGEGDIDEMEYESEFSDDEGKLEGEGLDEDEMKELDERMKREFRQANKTQEGYIDADDENGDDENQLSRAGREMKKLMRSHDKGGVYEEDDSENENPYLSDVEQEEDKEEEKPATQPENSRLTPQPNGIDSQPRPSIKRTSSTQNAPAVNGSTLSSRTTSPVPGQGGIGSGSSLVAKRATSPKPPKSLPLSGKASPPNGSPPSSRATSPVDGGSGSRATSPVGSSKQGQKRKADDSTAQATSPTSPNAEAGPSQAVAPKKKKHKSGATGTTASPLPGGELTAAMVVDWLRQHPNVTTKDCISYFARFLQGGGKEKQKMFTDLVKEVASLKGGILVLKPRYGGSIASPSPATT